MQWFTFRRPHVRRICDCAPNRRDPNQLRPNQEQRRAPELRIPPVSLYVSMGVVVGAVGGRAVLAQLDEWAKGCPSLIPAPVHPRQSTMTGSVRVVRGSVIIDGGKRRQEDGPEVVLLGDRVTPAAAGTGD